VFFFFSSRRRHTRSKRDWSSDVALPIYIDINSKTNRLEIDIMEIPSSCVIVICDGKAKIRELPPFGEYRIVTHQGKVKRMRRERSEERRVGKECRCR